MRSFSQFEPDPAPRNDTADPDAVTRSPREEPREEGEHAEILEQVLQETLSLAGEDASLHGPERDALCGIARRKGGELESPVVAELVSAMLSIRLGHVVAPSLREPMARTIAETLWEDPRSRERLEALWRRLREAVK